MNPLEKALSDKTNVALDFYLEDTATVEVRAHIEEIIDKATVSTPSGELKKQLQTLMEKW